MCVTAGPCSAVVFLICRSNHSEEWRPPDRRHPKVRRQVAGDYRATFDLGTVTKFSKWLGWQNSFGDVYVTNPPTSKKKNDVVFTTELNVTFAY